ncbi:hypothetical protein [Paractinoplanes lichenicola]|uniref:DUF7919 domain-containing protein n=1 Tax=Paractinoplanes lichenicola TaxID=2802976 RepID=A0ABS1VUG0_9ACTN|nr:hypothetical protein [Actinoplanes lichenicola]MBL7258119.1 hypothetical protein [Actinoplanes lichenicola]
MEYLDLSPYEFSSSALPMRSVGWLGAGHGVQGGTANPLTGSEMANLRAASRRVGSIALGFHQCEFCGEVEGNGEFRYYLPGGEIYAAPAMILHYAARHSYRPPRELLTDFVPPVWDWRAERVRALLLDSSADFQWRAGAIVDIAQWDDRRGFDALWHVMTSDEDRELLECTSDDIGRSLAAFTGTGLTAEDLHPYVRHAFETADTDQLVYLVRPASWT